MKHLVLLILIGFTCTAYFSHVYGQTNPDLSQSNIKDGKLKYPGHIAFDSFKNMYVIDATNYLIQKFDSNGNFILNWGSEGKQDGQFKCPYGIAVDSNNHVYVTDSCNQRIQIFDTDGKFISKWGKPGSGEGHLLSPAGIILDSDQNVYVVDDSRSSIQKFTKDGKFIAIWKTENDDVCKQYGATEKYEACKIGISGIAIDSNGDFFTIKRLSNLLEKISSEGVSIAKWKLTDNENNQVIYPEDIAVDSLGNLYITSEGAPFLYKYSGDGKFITKWLRKDMSHPFFISGIAIDSSDDVYVSIGSEYGSFGKNNVVEKYTNQGKLISKIGQPYFDNTSFSVYSPLKQIKMGIPQDLIACKSDLVLVIDHRYNPVCVKPESISKLVNRGWITNTSVFGGIPRECYLTPESGVCNSKIPKYYFDMETNSCKSFSWNGCRGTVPFDTLESCTSLCN